MIKAVVFGLAVGAGIQGWKQWPADGPVTVRAGILVALVGMAAAYLAGRYRGRSVPAFAYAAAHAHAKSKSQATATASPTQTVQVAVIAPGQGPRAAGGARMPDEAAVWFGGERREVTADDVDGMDLSELVVDVPYEVEP